MYNNNDDALYIFLKFFVKELLVLFCPCLCDDITLKWILYSERGSCLTYSYGFPNQVLGWLWPDFISSSLFVRVI